MHSLNPVWIPREETFEAFLVRINEIHGNGCPVCDGWAWVVGYGVKRPARLPCPECGGLDITPASADDYLAG